MTQCPTALAPTREVEDERVEATLRQRARVDRRHLFLHVEPGAGDDDAALARGERRGVAEESARQRYAVAGEDEILLVQHCDLLVAGPRGGMPAVSSTVRAAVAGSHARLSRTPCRSSSSRSPLRVLRLVQL